MIAEQFTEQLRNDWNNACLMAGVPAITLDTCARLFAVLYVHGNNEYMTHHKGFLADVAYIQKRFHIQGGEQPDPDFVMAVKDYISELEQYELDHKDERDGDGIFQRHIPEWATELFKNRYGIKLIN